MPFTPAASRWSPGLRCPSERCLRFLVVRPALRSQACGNRSAIGRGRTGLSIACSGSTGVSLAGLIPSASRDQPLARVRTGGRVRSTSRAMTIISPQIVSRENKGPLGGTSAARRCFEKRRADPGIYRLTRPAPARTFREGMIGLRRPSRTTSTRHLRARCLGLNPQRRKRAFDNRIVGPGHPGATRTALGPTRRKARMAVGQLSSGP